jgi:hypothetical protein
MRLKYSQRSTFATPIAAAVEAQRARLEAGKPVIVRLTPEGYDGEVTIVVNVNDFDSFDSNWEGTDESRFPARIRAAVTVLRDLNHSGRFLIIHEQGVLVISRWS